MVVRFYSSVAPETTLSSGITGASTSITVGSVTGFPSSTPYTLALDYEGITEELVQVNSAAGTTLTVSRAVDGTSAASHNAGARVRHVSSARDFADSRTHENSDQGIHGLAPGDTLVGEDAVQTLTNKTLDAPVINNPTITGTTSVVNADFSGVLHGTGTGTVRLDNVTNASPVSTGHAFQIGLTSAGNMRMDNNEIQAANNGVASSLGLQGGGGNVLAFNNVAADSVANSVTINGNVIANVVSATRPGATSTTHITRITGDANGRWFTQANGANRWSDGTATSDAGISRTAPGVLSLDNSLSITNGLTVPNITQSGTATLNNVQLNGNNSAINLTVTGTFNPPQTTASGATVGAIASGWSQVSLTGMKVGGSTYITGVVQRTGPTLTPDTGPPTGNIGDSTLFTLTPAWRPSSGYTTAIACTITDGISHGAGRLNTDGTVDFLTWMPGVLIGMGDGNNYRFSLSFPSA